MDWPCAKSNLVVLDTTGTFDWLLLLFAPKSMEVGTEGEVFDGQNMSKSLPETFENAVAQTACFIFFLYVAQTVHSEMKTTESQDINRESGSDHLSICVALGQSPAGQTCYGVKSDRIKWQILKGKHHDLMQKTTVKQ